MSIEISKVCVWLFSCSKKKIIYEKKKKKRKMALFWSNTKKDAKNFFAKSNFNTVQFVVFPFNVNTVVAP